MALNMTNVTFERRARETGGSALMLWAVARFAGSNVLFASDPGAGAPGFTLSPASRARTFYSDWILGLAPQALRCRPLRGLERFIRIGSWGWRPRLYAVARFAGSNVLFASDPGAGAPGFTLSPASRARTFYSHRILGLAP